MKWVILALLCLGQPVQAQAPDIDAVLEGLGPLFAAEDSEGVQAHLSAAIREARAADALDAEWGILFAMFADETRLKWNNPAYALRLAEEGLDLVAAAPNPDQEILDILNVSRAYSLADLGRRQEAARIATLAMPMMRRQMGDKIADDLLANVKIWTEGGLGQDNLAADDLAGQVLDEGYKALGRGEYGAVLTLAARAVLPKGTGLDAAKVRAANIGAGSLRGQALFALDRKPQAVVALSGAAELLVPGWQTAAVQESDEPRGWEVFFWLGRAALDSGQPELARQALAMTEAFPAIASSRRSAQLQRVELAVRSGHPEAGEAILLAAIAQSQTMGAPAEAALAGFYLARLRADMAPDWASVDAEAIVAATENAMAFSDRADMPMRGFFMSEAALYLVHTDSVDKGIDYARRALREGQAEGVTGSELQLGKDQAHLRDLAGVFLTGSNRRVVADSRAICPNEFDGQGCVVILPVEAR